MSAESACTAVGIYVGAGAAALSGQSSLASVGTRFAVVSAALTFQSSLAAAATVVQLGAAIEVGSSELVATAIRVPLASASLTAQSDVTAVAVRVLTGAASSIAFDTACSSVAVIVKISPPATMTSELTFTPASALPIYRLAQPKYEQVYTDALPFSRFGIDTAKTVYIKNNTVTVTDYVYQDDIESADYAYLGGRHYQLSQSEYDAFVSAGRSDLVEVA
jgi:hypothetical protein